MTDSSSVCPPSEKYLRRLVWLGVINLTAVVLLGAAVLVGLLPKLERMVAASERVEARFQAFADEVQPVIGAGASKAVETLGKIDAEKLSETATESSDAAIRAAGERAKRWLDREGRDGER